MSLPPFLTSRLSKTKKGKQKTPTHIVEKQVRKGELQSDGYNSLDQEVQPPKDIEQLTKAESACRQRPEEGWVRVSPLFSHSDGGRDKANGFSFGFRTASSENQNYSRVQVCRTMLLNDDYSIKKDDDGKVEWFYSVWAKPHREGDRELVVEGGGASSTTFQDTHTQRMKALEIKCPSCKAEINKPCMTKTGMKTNMHKARIKGVE
jgi:hypothetical protein